MKKRELSEDELNRVKNLRQSGTSWPKIENDTGIPRRAAKRAYDNWLRNQPMQEVKEARKEVAAEEFRKHMNSLIKQAASLINYLAVPPSADLVTSSDHTLASFFEQDILHGLEPPDLPEINEVSLGLSAIVESYERPRIIRQNQLLFESLQEHTREKVRWDAFDEWKQSQDNCAKIVADLRTESHKTVENYIKQEAELPYKIRDKSGEKDAVGLMEQAALNSLWRGTIDEATDEEWPLIEVVSRGKGTAQIISVNFGKQAVLVLNDTVLATNVAKICNQTTTILRRGQNSEMAQELAKEIRRMRRLTTELAERLDPLLLRPLILRTRCDLCPA